MSTFRFPCKVKRFSPRACRMLANTGSDVPILLLYMNRPSKVKWVTFTLPRARFISLGLFLPKPPSALLADLSSRSFSEAGTATYVTRTRGGVGGALSDGRPYPNKLFKSFIPSSSCLLIYLINIEIIKMWFSNCIV